MKLAEFLAEHIRKEDILIDGITPESGEVEFIIQQGIEAFATTENVSVGIYDRSVAIPKEYYS